MKNRELIPFRPLVIFILQCYKCGGVSVSKLHHLLPWLVKLIIFEPLRLAEVLVFNRQIEKQVLRQDPVFILGYYRSGTTYLQRLMILDPSIATQNVFQSALPEITLSTETILKPVMNRITRLFNVQNRFHSIPFEWNFPGEEDVAMLAGASPFAANWANLFPGQFEAYYNRFVYFEESDPDFKKNWMNVYSKHLKKLNMRYNGKRLLLKSPPNTARIKELLTMYPNARFIMIKRKTSDVLASGLNFWKITDRYYALQNSSDVMVQKNLSSSYQKCISAYENNKHLIPSNNLIELNFEDLRSDIVKTMKQIYKTLELAEYEEMENKIKAFVNVHSNYRQKDYSKVKHPLIESQYRTIEPDIHNNSII